MEKKSNTEVPDKAKWVEKRVIDSFLIMNVFYMILILLAFYFGVKLEDSRIQLSCQTRNNFAITDERFVCYKRGESPSSLYQHDFKDVDYDTDEKG